MEEEKQKSSTKSVTSVGSSGKPAPRRRGPPTRKTASNNLKDEIGE